MGSGEKGTRESTAPGGEGIFDFKTVTFLRRKKSRLSGERRYVIALQKRRGLIDVG